MFRFSTRQKAKSKVLFATTLFLTVCSVSIDEQHSNMCISHIYFLLFSVLFGNANVRTVNSTTQLDIRMCNTHNAATFIVIYCCCSLTAGADGGGGAITISFDFKQFHFMLILTTQITDGWIHAHHSTPNQTHRHTD